MSTVSNPGSLSETRARILSNTLSGEPRREAAPPTARLSLALCLHHWCLPCCESLATCQIRVSQGGTQPADWDPQLGRRAPAGTSEAWLVGGTAGPAGQQGWWAGWPKPAGRRCTGAGSCGPTCSASCFELQQRAQRVNQRLNTVQPVHGTVAGRWALARWGARWRWAAGQVQSGAQRRLGRPHRLIHQSFSYAALLRTNTANQLARGGYMLF